jgi:hypothetical protein
MEIRLPMASTIFPDAGATKVNQYYALQGVQVILRLPLLCYTPFQMTVRGVSISTADALTTTTTLPTTAKNNAAAGVFAHVGVIVTALFLL